MRTRSEPHADAAETQDAPPAFEQRRDPPGPPSGADRNDRAEASAAAASAAEFERLKARLRQLVGTNSNARR